MRFTSHAVPSLVCAWLAVFLTACTTPPTKEMQEAQDAIDAARAAGAEQYAPTEYTAAVNLLDQAQEAVEAGDSRLALSHALDAREQAQAASTEAASQKAVARREAGRALDAVAADIEELDHQLEAAQAARIPAGQMAESRMTRAAMDPAVQEARATLAKEDYLAAREAAEKLAAQVRQAIEEIEAALAAGSPR